MDKIKILLSSKVFWSIAGVFAVQGLTAILPMLGQGHVAQIVQAILALVAIYQHPNEVVGAAKTGMFGSVKIR